jgi:hypothetical protein
MSSTALEVAIATAAIGAGSAAAIVAAIHTLHVAHIANDSRRQSRIRRQRHRRRPPVLYTQFFWRLSMWDDGKVEFRLRYI